MKKLVLSLMMMAAWMGVSAMSFERAQAEALYSSFPDDDGSLDGCQRNEFRACSGRGSLPDGQDGV